MANEPQPMFTKEDLEHASVKAVFVNDVELADASVDHFRATGENFSEWTAHEPETAYDALRKAVAARRFGGNLAAAARSGGLPERLEDDTLLSVRVHRPTLRNRLTGTPPNPGRSKEVGRIITGRSADE